MPFSGRDRERGELVYAIEQAMSGMGRLLLFSGQSGIGKSRLLGVTRQEAAARGCLVLRGEVTVHAGSPPYQIWIDALGQFDGSTIPNILLSNESRHGMTRAPGRSAWDDPTHRHFQIAAQFQKVLNRLCHAEPVVITIDDLQWCDDASLELLKYLAYRCGGMRLLIAGAFRNEEGTSSIARLASTLTADRRAALLPLQPLTAIEIEPAVASLLGRTEPEWTVQLVQHCQGNPFVLNETMRALSTSRAWDDSLPDVVSLPLPHSIGAALRSRLERLEPSRRRLVDVLAVSGDPLSCSVISATLGQDQDLVQNDVNAIVDLTLAVLIPGADEERCRLAHHWIRDVTLDLLPAGEQQRLHHALATVQENAILPNSGPAVFEAIARHYQLGNDGAKAAVAARSLGIALRSTHAHREAAAAFARAIELLPFDRAALAELEQARADALLRSGSAGAVDAYRAAAEQFRALGQMHEAAKAIGMQGVAHARAERQEQALANFDEALILLDGVPDGERTRAWVLFHRADTLGLSTTRFEEALAAQQEAMVLLGEHAASDPLAIEAALALARTLLRINRLEEARAILEKALSEALRAGELWLAAETEGSLANYYNWMGNIQQSRTSTLRRQVHAEASGDLFARRHVSAWLAFMEVVAGNWGEAERLLASGRAEIDVVESPEPAAWARQVTGVAALFRGQYAEALDHFLAALAGFRQLDPSGLAWYIGCAAYAAFRSGNQELADQLVTETEAIIDQLPDVALARCPALLMLGLIAAESNHFDRAAVIRQQLLPFTGQKHWILVDRVLGVLTCMTGDSDAGLAFLERAAVQARRFGLRTELAVTLAEDARFRERPDGERAAELNRAVDRLRSLGMNGEAQRIASYRASPPTSGYNLDRLSPRERDVLRLMATGKTNAEIAEILFISPRTVEHHVSHIFTKIGIERRSEAAVAAVRHGLI